MKQNEITYTERDEPYRRNKCPRCGDLTENKGLCQECQQVRKMPNYKKYPKRSEYNTLIGEGKNLLFDLNQNTNESTIVSVAWYGAAFDRGGYKITMAFTVAKNMSYLYPDYPFIKSKKDKAFVTKTIQSNCEHAFDNWNYHAVCWKCGLVTHGDYRELVLRNEGVEAIDMHDDYIVAQYGKEGLALRRARAGATEVFSKK